MTKEEQLLLLQLDDEDLQLEKQKLSLAKKPAEVGVGTVVSKTLGVGSNALRSAAENQISGKPISEVANFLNPLRGELPRGVATQVAEKYNIPKGLLPQGASQFVKDFNPVANFVRTVTAVPDFLLDKSGYGPDVAQDFVKSFLPTNIGSKVAEAITPDSVASILDFGIDVAADIPTSMGAGALLKRLGTVPAVNKAVTGAAVKTGKGVSYVGRSLSKMLPEVADQYLNNKDKVARLVQRLRTPSISDDVQKESLSLLEQLRSKSGALGKKIKEEDIEAVIDGKWIDVNPSTLDDIDEISKGIIGTKGESKERMSLANSLLASTRAARNKLNATKPNAPFPTVPDYYVTQEGMQIKPQAIFPEREISTSATPDFDDAQSSMFSSADLKSVPKYTAADFEAGKVANNRIKDLPPAPRSPDETLLENMTLKKASRKTKADKENPLFEEISIVPKTEKQFLSRWNKYVNQEKKVQQWKVLVEKIKQRNLNKGVQDDLLSADGAMGRQTSVTKSSDPLQMTEGLEMADERTLVKGGADFDSDTFRQDGFPFGQDPSLRLDATQAQRAKELLDRYSKFKDSTTTSVEAGLAQEARQKGVVESANTLRRGLETLGPDIQKTNQFLGQNAILGEELSSMIRTPLTSMQSINPDHMARMVAVAKRTNDKELFEGILQNQAANKIQPGASSLAPVEDLKRFVGRGLLKEGDNLQKFVAPKIGEAVVSPKTWVLLNSL